MSGIILLLSLACCVFYYLFGVLGTGKQDSLERINRKMQHYPLPDDLKSAGLETTEEIIVIAENVSADLAKTLRKIHAKDKRFTQQYFLDSVQQVYELLNQALSDGDLPTLKKLSTIAVAQHFTKIIKQREKTGKFLQRTIVAINNCQIESAKLQGKAASITVKFETEQILIERDTQQQIISGDPSKVQPITEIWRLEKNLAEQSAIWYLAAIQTKS